MGTGCVIYRPEAKSPIDRVEGYRVAPEEVPPGVDEWWPQRRFWEDVCWLYLRVITDHKRVRHRSILQRWKANRKSGARLDSLHHLRSTIGIRIPNRHIWYGEALLCSNVHLRDAGVNKPWTAVSPFAIDTETHLDHGPVSWVISVGQPRIEACERAAFHDCLRQAEMHTLR